MRPARFFGLAPFFLASWLGTQLVAGRARADAKLERANQVESNTPESTGSRRRRPSRGARAELATLQTLVGAAMGVEVCVMLECSEPRAWAGATLLGASGGLTVSLLATRDGIPQGRAQAVNTGALYGTFLGGALLAIGLPPGESASPQAAGGMLLGGQLLGAALGLVADNQLTLTQGEVSLAGGAALWTGLATTLAITAFEPDEDESMRRAYGALLGTSALALVGGFALARHDDVSRGRALLVDAGAFLGAGLFPLAAWLIRGDELTPELGFGASAAGIVTGGVLMYVLTRHWDVPEGPPVSLSLAPVHGGAVASLRLTR